MHTEAVQQCARRTLATAAQGASSGLKAIGHAFQDAFPRGGDLQNPSAQVRIMTPLTGALCTDLAVHNVDSALLFST